MNNNDFFLTIIFGALLGVFIFAGTVIALGNSPKQLNEKWKIEIIKHGYAEMVVVDDKLEFKWKDDLTKTKSEVE
jgi:hypothetical protein